MSRRYKNHPSGAGGVMWGAMYEGSRPSPDMVVNHGGPHRVDALFPWMNGHDAWFTAYRTECGITGNVTGNAFMGTASLGRVHHCHVAQLTCETCWGAVA